MYQTSVPQKRSGLAQYDGAGDSSDSESDSSDGDLFNMLKRETASANTLCDNPPLPQKRFRSSASAEQQNVPVSRADSSCVHKTARAGGSTPQLAGHVTKKGGVCASVNAIR
jgi:hypothetical protein